MLCDQTRNKKGQYPIYLITHTTQTSTTKLLFKTQLKLQQEAQILTLQTLQSHLITSN